MQTVIFGVVATAIWGGIHFYIGRRLIDGSRLPRPWNLVAWTVVATHASLSPLAFFLARRLEPSAFLEVLQWATYLGMGFFVLLLSLLLARDAVLLLLWLVRRLNPSDPAPSDPDRRTMLTSGLNLGIFAASGIATGIGYREARARPTVEDRVLEVEGLPADLDGFRIVQISDMHVGPTLRRPFVETVVEIVNELDADLIAVTGDLIDGHVRNLHSELEPLATMRARHGTYYCTGNHEWYWDANSWKGHASNLGMRALANEHHLIRVGSASLLVGGVDDYSCGRHGGVTDPALAMRGAPPHDYSVLLAHQPKSCYEASAAGWRLQVSGHTHGGQFYPWNFFVGLAHPFSAGWGNWKGTDVYVNRGTGYWGPPLRLGVPSEITRITLRAA